MCEVSPCWIAMGMCAVRGAVVMASPSEDETATPRSTMSSASFVSATSSQDVETAEVDDQGGQRGSALWQRTIPRGRRCRPLSFSGVIAYDEAGNQLPMTRRDLEPLEDDLH